MTSPQHWKDKLFPMEGQRWPIRCGMALTDGDVAKLREGLWPQDMDERWVVWLDGEVLRAWRSWTGTCVYEAQVMLRDDGSALVGMLSVLDDPEQYCRSRTDSGELERFEGVLGLALTSQVA